MHALRRTPPSEATPYADGPPVLRILYAFCQITDRGEVAIVLLGGDTTTLGNSWHPANVAEAEGRLGQYVRHHTNTKPIIKRGNR